LSITKREHSLPLPKIFWTYCTNRDKEVIGGKICGRDLFVASHRIAAPLLPEAEFEYERYEDY